MASLTCPNCGKDNPDFLDDCQFCQTPLRREATLNIGENPTKKSTGELEGVLPDWLRDARQQARDSAEEEAAKEASKAKPQKEEPLDLLAGLAFQAESDEEDVPDWLSAIRPVQGQKTPASSKTEDDQPSDFFAKFEQPKQESIDISRTIPVPGETHDEALPWMSGNAAESEKDELSDWFSQTSAQTNEAFRFDAGETPIGPTDDLSAPLSREPATPERSEDLSWLRNLEASAKQESEGSAMPSTDADTGWMSNLESSSGKQEDLNWLNNLGGMSAPSSQAESEPGELDWLTNLGGTPLPDEPAAAPRQPVSSPEEDLGWLKNLGGMPPASEPTSSEPAPAESNDLSWLDNLGTPTPAEPAKEDLSWLNSFGEAPAESAKPAPSTDDLSWLNNLGGTPAEEAPAGPASAQADLDWLNNLSGPTPSEPSSSQPAASADDLSWLKELGATPAAPVNEPQPAQENLDWLENLGSMPAASSDEPAPLSQPDVPDWLKNMEAEQSVESAEPPQLSPRHTAPLSQDAMQEIPDWLKSATEASASPSMPPLGAAARDWFTPVQQPAEEPRVDERKGQPARAKAEEQTPEAPVPTEQGVFSAPNDSSLANQDGDALFAVEMPDWLSQPEPAADEQVSGLQQAVPTGHVGDLAPVDLPSWVQAMRPVEAVMDEASAIAADQTTEREGPLAGLRGVIPFAPIGSAQRPKAISLKLQATAEQQASASLVEQIIAGEATPHPLKVAPFVASQRALRWVLAGLFLVLLSVVVGLGSQALPIFVSQAQTEEINRISSTLLNIPEGAPVLIVIDYEPSLAGEIEATSGPLLDQMMVLRKPSLIFVSTSPNGTGLVDRLLANTKINIPVEAGYLNAGYLPGGLAGVRGFTEAPAAVLPAVNVNSFSQFASVVILTDHAESGQMWIEQLTLAKQTDPALVNQQLLVVASAQAGPMLRPYVSSQQVTGLVSGLSDAARYEYMNGTRPGIVRSYWDAFGVGLLLAIVSIVIGSLWSLFTGIRARRAEAESG